MKALVLSGGKGTRLRPITHTSAKQLVPVANKPILLYGLESIVEAGITDIGVVVGDTHEEIKNTLGDGSAFGAKLTYIRQEEPLGLAHAVKISHDFLKSDPFVMYLGDNLILGGIKRFVKEFGEKKPVAKILLAKVPNPQDFGVAELKGDRVVSLIEKPQDPKSDLALVGVYLFTEAIFKSIEAIKPSARGELEITDAIQNLLDGSLKVEYEVVEGWWKDTGKLGDLLEANRMVLDSNKESMEADVDGESTIDFKVSAGKGTKIIKSNIQGPVVIGENCVIENAYIGPFTSIDDNVTLRNCEIENSVVMNNVSIHDLTGRITESLIGRNVEITKSNGTPKAHRFMIGDSSIVEVI